MGKNKLVQITTADGLYLHGYYVPADDRKFGVLHIHGFESNFYQNSFIYTLADELERAGVGFLTINTRGNGKDTDFYTTGGTYKRIGSRYELLEEAHLDITAGLKLLIDEGYQEIVLEGHSGGTVKAVRYLFEGNLEDRVNKLVLLAPIDPLGFRIARGRTNIQGYLQKAQTKVDMGKGEELITADFDHDELSYRTFISWYKQDDLGRMFEFCSPGYNFPILRQIGIPTKIIVGSKDEYFYPSNPDHPEGAMELLLKNIPNSKGKIINGANHFFRLYESVMAREAAEFITGREILNLPKLEG